MNTLVSRGPHAVGQHPDPVIMQPRYARNGRGAPDVVSSPLDAEGGATSDKRQIVAAGSFWDGGQVSQCIDAVTHKGQTMPEKGRFPAVITPASFYGQMKAESQCYRADGTCNTLINGTNPGHQNHVMTPIIRRLTPVECLHLQGFPSDYFDDVPGYSDTQAYKAIGNSIAVPCVEWIFRRIFEFDNDHAG